mgnify:CR=1 FL=1
MAKVPLCPVSPEPPRGGRGWGRPQEAPPRGMRMDGFDVAIIGFGPVGAPLANLLADCGLSVLVLEREADIYPLPRAVHFDDEVMRVFQALGLAERMLPHTHVSPGMRFEPFLGSKNRLSLT